MSQSTLAPNQAMAVSQLYTNGITDETLLQAIASVPRQAFVPEHLENCAYVDEDIAIGEGRYMLAPLEQAQLIQAARITPTDRILNIACGMGYSVAALATQVPGGQVVGIDVSAMFKQHAEQAFASSGISNASVEVVEDLTQGFEYAAPYDVILINGNVQHISDMLASQLAEGGRIVFVTSNPSAKPGVQGLGSLTCGVKRSHGLDLHVIQECSVPTLPAFTSPPTFRFG